MEERVRTGSEGDEISLGELFAILREEWRKIALLSLAAGVATFIVMLAMPNVYRATAVIAPTVEEKRPNPALGILASFGVDIGSPSKVEDLETLFKSNDLTVRVFQNHSAWSIVLPEKFDSKSGKMKEGLIDRLFYGENRSRAPRDWDAIRIAKKHLKVFINNKTGTVSLFFESPSAEGSSNILKYYLDEGKNRLQEEALDRAGKNKIFIEEQIGKTVDALTRDKLYALYGQEVEREMLAKNREQFGFRVIDTPRIPDRKLKPQRGIGLIISVLLSFLVGWIYFILQKRPMGKR